ncbi:MAG TPA: PH domain-containing protein [Planctomycetota bacterium]|nr:PH domain-containing protein [Planctomycetota bacterium]
MEALEFRPCKALLAIWLVIAAVCCLILGGLVAAIQSEGDLAEASMAVFAPGALIPWMASSAYAVLYFFSIRYRLDDRYVTKACGVLWKKRRSIPLEKITNLDVRQGPVERLLGFGQVWIFTPSTGAMRPEEKLVGLPDPHGMKQTLVDYTENVTRPRAPAETPAATPAASGDRVVSVLEDIRETLRRIETALRKDDAE